METREEFVARRNKEIVEGQRELPNGCTLFWKTGDMGREYFSDEIGGGVSVWHTSLVSDSTLLAALTQEQTCRHSEYQKAMEDNKEVYMNASEKQNIVAPSAL